MILASAAAANGLPLEFFARVIWEESRFQPNTVGPMTRSGHRAQGIAQFMPYTADERGLLDPFDPEAALPRLRSSWPSYEASSAILALPSPRTMPGRAACATSSVDVAAYRPKHGIMCAPSPDTRSMSGRR